MRFVKHGSYWRQPFHRRIGLRLYCYVLAFYKFVTMQRGCHANGFYLRFFWSLCLSLSELKIDMTYRGILE